MGTTPLTTTLLTTTPATATVASATITSHSKTSMKIPMEHVKELTRQGGSGATLLGTGAVTPGSHRGILTTPGHTKHVGAVGRNRFVEQELDKKKKKKKKKKNSSALIPLL